MTSGNDIFIKDGDGMPTNEKEYNGYLFDQLTLLERLEITAKKDNAVDTLKQIEFERKAIERKLYQNPSLLSEQTV
jgi:hypothetical protein